MQDQSQSVLANGPDLCANSSLAEKLSGEMCCDRVLSWLAEAYHHSAPQLFRPHVCRHESSSLCRAASIALADSRFQNKLACWGSLSLPLSSEFSRPADNESPAWRILLTADRSADRRA